MISSLLFRRVSIPLVVSLAAVIAGCSSTASSTNNAAGRSENPVRIVDLETAKRGAATRTGEVYLMRGLMDVFSRGIDQMAVMMRREGLYAVNTSYHEWENIAQDILRRKKRKELSQPVIIIGHSLGADDATKMASYLGERGVKIPLVVTFDPTEPGYVGKNVGKVINYYLPNDDNNKVFRRKGFKGKIINVNVSRNPDISHTTVEKNPELQAKTISRVIKLTRRKKKR